ncbi:MAG: hypothetical protein ACXWCE_18355 [Caldimonas sp.]
MVVYCLFAVIVALAVLGVRETWHHAQREQEFDGLDRGGAAK